MQRPQLGLCAHSRPLPAVARCSNVRRTRTVRVAAVFEKFSERSIKSVMFAQQEAKNLGAAEVRTAGALLKRAQTSRRHAYR